MRDNKMARYHHAVYGPGNDWYGTLGEGPSKYRTFRRVTLTILTGALLVVGPVLNNITHSEGTKVGVINEFSERGTFLKTYEGQMVLEGILGSQEKSEAGLWKFSLDNSAKHDENVFNLALKLNNYSNEGTKVKIDYSRPVWSWPWRSKTNYHVLSVEPVQK